MTIGPLLSLPLSPSSPTGQISTTDIMKHCISESMNSPPTLYSPSSSPLSALFGSARSTNFDNYHHRHHHHHRFRHRSARAMFGDHPYSQSLKDCKRIKFSDRIEEDFLDFLNNKNSSTDFSKMGKSDANANTDIKCPVYTGQSSSLLLGTDCQLTPPLTPTSPVVDQEVKTTVPELRENYCKDSIPRCLPASQQEITHYVPQQLSPSKLPCQTSNHRLESPDSMSDSRIGAFDNKEPPSTSERQIPESLTVNSSSTSNDAMLSSSLSIDRQNSNCEDILDTDFLQELDDLDFDFGAFDPCCDVKMDDDSFQVFVESTLDDAFPEDFDDICGGQFANNSTAHNHCVYRRYRRNSSSSSNEPVIVDQAGFMEVLGLRPSASASVRTEQYSPKEASDSVNSSFSCDHNEGNRSASSQNAEVSSPIFDLLPTTMCSCSRSSGPSGLVYTTASPSTKENVRICSSVFSSLTKGSSSSGAIEKLYEESNDASCFSCTKIRLETSQELLPPLSIDTCNYGVLPPSEATVDSSNNLKPQVFKNDMDELLELLSDETFPEENSRRKIESMPSQEVKIISSNSLSSSFSERDEPCGEIDSESFKDLSQFLDDSLCEEMDSAEQLPSNDIHHDHTYQKIPLTNNEKKDVKDHSQAQSVVNPFYSDEHFFRFSNASEQFSASSNSQSRCLTPLSNNSYEDLSNNNDETMQHLDLSSWNSSSGDCSSLSPSSKTTPKAAKEVEENNQLELLNLFSDETAPPLFYQESTLRHFRFV